MVQNINGCLLCSCLFAMSMCLQDSLIFSTLFLVANLEKLNTRGRRYIFLLCFTPFYLFIVGVGDWCCTWLHSLTHIHTWYEFSEWGISPLLGPVRDNTQHPQETAMTPLRFKPTIPANEQLQTYTLDYMATWVSWICVCELEVRYPYLWKEIYIYIYILCIARDLSVISEP
jgi:hypothetical protein